MLLALVRFRTAHLSFASDFVTCTVALPGKKKANFDGVFLPLHALISNKLALDIPVTPAMMIVGVE